MFFCKIGWKSACLASALGEVNWGEVRQLTCVWLCAHPMGSFVLCVCLPDFSRHSRLWPALEGESDFRGVEQYHYSASHMHA